MSKIKIFSLGGLNENSKNMYVVEVDEDIFVFEAGLKYADDKFLGVDYIIPDYSYIKNRHHIRCLFFIMFAERAFYYLKYFTPDSKIFRSCSP